MKAAEIRGLSTPELEKRLEESYRELFNLRFQLATHQLTNTSELRRVKKDIARLNTILGERRTG